MPNYAILDEQAVYNYYITFGIIPWSFVNINSERLLKVFEEPTKENKDGPDK